MEFKDIIDEYLHNNVSIEKIALKYHVGKLKIKCILKENNIPLKKIGGQSHNNEYIVSDWKIEKYPQEDGCHYIAVDKNDETYHTLDYMNNAGVLTTYIKEKYGIETPTLYYRREYYKKTGNYWWEQWFNIIKEKNNKTKKCPYCDWETIDIENKSGVFEQHLREKHNKTVDDYVKEFPNEIDYFSNYKKKKEKEKLFLEDKFYVECPLCGEKLKKITLWHCKSKHNMSLLEFRSKFTQQKVVSDFSHDLDAENFKLGNLTPTTKDRFISKYEKEIRKFLDEHNIQYEHNRQILFGKEIDILIHDKHIGIEFNGLRFHTEKFGKDKNYHLNKTIKCNEKGYGLIHIFEDEYVNHKDIVYSKLSHILHLDDNLPKISGRKITVKKIYKNDAMQFLNQYHIQGFASSTVYLGGFYNEELVAVMSFKHGNVKNTNWELTRFATKYNYRYQGVGGKLFKYFIREYNPKYIVSFADRRWTIDKDSNLYTLLGFNLEKINQPDYRYYNDKIDRYKRIHKMTFNKNTLSKKYGFPITMTEKEMTQELGYERIWNCGLFKYVWCSN